MSNHCICMTCNNKNCEQHKCDMDCTRENPECTIDGFVFQCSGYIGSEGKNE